MSDLLYKKKNTFEEKDDAFIKKAYDYCEGYKAFLEQSYIERPGIETVKKQAEEKHISAQLVMQNYMLERLLERISV